MSALCWVAAGVAVLFVVVAVMLAALWVYVALAGDPLDTFADGDYE